MKKNKEPEKAPNHERWLLTYADLITLLMTFFVILYALSLMDQKKFGRMAESLRVALGKGSPSIMEVNQGNMVQSMGEMRSDSVESMQIENAKNEIGAFLKENNLDEEIQTDTNSDGNIEIFLNDGILFAPGQASLKPAGVMMLRKIGFLIAKIDNSIVIEGHTDNIPISNGIYASNWELSAARALSVEKFLIDAAFVKPTKTSIHGYGEFKPVSPNTTAENRARNRRVAIVIVKKQTLEL